MTELRSRVGGDRQPRHYPSQEASRPRPGETEGERVLVKAAAGRLGALPRMRPPCQALKPRKKHSPRPGALGQGLLGASESVLVLSEQCVLVSRSPLSLLDTVSPGFHSPLFRGLLCAALVSRRGSLVCSWDPSLPGAGGGTSAAKIALRILTRHTVCCQGTCPFYISTLPTSPDVASSLYA